MEEKKIKKLIKKFKRERKLNFLHEDKFDFETCLEEIIKVLRTGRLDILEGMAHREFEQQFAEWIGAKEAVFVNSGTAALFCVLRASGIGPGDEVIIPPFTFMATASCILHTNAIPRFADIETVTYNMDPEDAISKINSKTKAIIPVHLGGMPQDIGPLKDACEDRGILLLEDACQAHGAKYNGKMVGTIGDAGTFSFFPSKNMTTGEGGMIVTDNEELAEQCRIIRHHGETAWYKFARLGWHLRPTELTAAIGLAELKNLKRYIRSRQQAWFYLTENLQDVKGITPPGVPDYAEPSCNWWGGIVSPGDVGAEDTQEYTNWLNKKNAFTKTIYPKPIYQTVVFREGDSFLPEPLPEYPDGLCPVCEDLNKRLIAIDTHPGITKEHCDFIIERFHAVAKGN
ncbi:aminotransferase class V-fold PLP-dependent enzyme [Candidatus Bathyarchaeota archaeon]|nr:aminotransferase class V-fold PLP-dependent enzyme [Candidatus Bathyarchaeota archaeon]